VRGPERRGGRGGKGCNPKENGVRGEGGERASRERNDRHWIQNKGKVRQMGAKLRRGPGVLPCTRTSKKKPDAGRFQVSKKN